MLKLASLVINKGVELSQVGMVFLSIVPTFLEIAIPLASLLGVMLALARLSGDSEITVMRSSGISLYQLIRPVALFGVFAFCLTLVVSLQLKPWGYDRLSRTLFEIARRKSTAGLSAGTFNDLGTITLYAEKIDHQTGDLEGVLIHDRRKRSERKVITAKNGAILSSPEEESITFHLKDGEIHELAEGKYIFTQYETNDILTNPDELYTKQEKTRGRIRPRELSNAQIYQELQTRKEFSPIEPTSEPSTLQENLESAPQKSIEQQRKENDDRIRRLRIEYHRRFSIPFAAFLLALFAMPLGIQPPRTQRSLGAGLSASIGLVVFVFYFALLSVGVALGESGVLPPMLAVWLPNIVIGISAYFTLQKMGTEQWQSFAHALEDLFKKIQRKLEKAENL